MRPRLTAMCNLPFLPIESATLKRARPSADARRRLGLLRVMARGVGHQPRDRLAATSNQDFFTALDPVEQGAEFVLGLDTMFSLFCAQFTTC